MFLMKYAISVKREEMRKLEKLAREEEQKLLIAEQAKLTITLNPGASGCINFDTKRFQLIFSLTS